jgi:hypothetical protein
LQPETAVVDAVDSGVAMPGQQERSLVPTATGLGTTAVKVTGQAVQTQAVAAAVVVLVAQGQTRHSKPTVVTAALGSRLIYQVSPLTTRVAAVVERRVRQMEQPHMVAGTEEH